jgi:Domain of unknown function (DUF4276)
VREIRIYIEGGGDSVNTKARLREGFHEFLKTIIELAREKRIRFYLVACGSRNATFDAFRTALRDHSDAFNVLLVDSEEPVNVVPREHLQGRDRWDLSHALDEQCHLMAQTMEAWLIADLAALQDFYGQGFNANSIPRTANVEQIDKPTLNTSLEAATRRTQKGIYHKIKHGAEILKRIDSDRVRTVATHCDRLFVELRQQIES